MNKIRYLIALLYTDIKSRRPDGTPYFNVRVCITFGLWLHLLQVLLLLKVTAHINIIPKGENSFIGCTFLLILFWLITWLFPLKNITDVEVKPAAIKGVKYYYFGYFIASILFFVCLLILDSNNPM